MIVPFPTHTDCSMCFVMWLYWWVGRFNYDWDASDVQYKSYIYNIYMQHKIYWVTVRFIRCIIPTFDEVDSDLE